MRDGPAQRVEGQRELVQAGESAELCRDRTTQEVATESQPDKARQLAEVGGDWPTQEVIVETHRIQARQVADFRWNRAAQRGVSQMQVGQAGQITLPCAAAWMVRLGQTATTASNGNRRPRAGRRDGVFRGVPARGGKQLLNARRRCPIIQRIDLASTTLCLLRISVPFDPRTCFSIHLKSPCSAVRCDIRPCCDQPPTTLRLPASRSRGCWHPPDSSHSSATTAARSSIRCTGVVPAVGVSSGQARAPARAAVGARGDVRGAGAAAGAVVDRVDPADRTGSVQG